MKVRTCLAISMCVLLITAAEAQDKTQVTFSVPLNLSQLSSDIATVGVFCTVASAAIQPNGSSYALSRHTPAGGRVQTTAVVRVDITRLDDPAGKSATYRCVLRGLRTGQSVWVDFGVGASDSAFRISPNPTPITGSFDWVQAPSAVDVAPVNATTTSPNGNP
jgi:hypothetical protein